MGVTISFYKEVYCSHGSRWKMVMMGSTNHDKEVEKYLKNLGLRGQPAHLSYGVRDLELEPTTWLTQAEVIDMVESGLFKWEGDLWLGNPFFDGDYDLHKDPKTDLYNLVNKEGFREDNHVRFLFEIY